jgi:hypothetical protein
VTQPPKEKSLVVGFVNRYLGKEERIWAGRTVFPSIEDARSCPCADTTSYIDTCALVPAEATHD